MAPAAAAAPVVAEAAPDSVRTSAPPAEGIPLTRLLGITRLTPAQAVAIGTDVLACLEERDAADVPGGGLSLESVRVSTEGRAHLGADDRSGGGGPASPDPATVAALLGDLAAAVQPPNPKSVSANGTLLTALSRALTEARRPGGTVATVRTTLCAADAAGGADARAELARLVSASTGEGVPLVQAARPRPPSPASDPPPPPRRPRRVARTVVGRTWKWVLSLVVLVAVIAIEITFLRDTITRDIEALFEASRSGTDATTSTSALPPVVPPAPAAGGTIVAVDLRAVQPCRPDADCAVRLQVVLQPRPEPQTVIWGFRVLDRCTGVAANAPGGTVTVPPEGDRTDAIVTVGLPRGDALAVLALTEQPATAASPPLLVPADGVCGAHPAEQSR